MAGCSCWPNVQYGMNCFSISDAPRVELRLGRSLNASNIKEGDDVYFECLIQSNPAPNTIIWTRNVSYKALCLSATSWRMYSSTCLSYNLQCVHCTSSPKFYLFNLYICNCKCKLCDDKDSGEHSPPWCYPSLQRLQQLHWPSANFNK